MMSLRFYAWARTVKPTTVAGYTALNDVAKAETGDSILSVGIFDNQALIAEFDEGTNNTRSFMWKAVTEMAADAPWRL
jgi:hypothetical protein